MSEMGAGFITTWSWPSWRICLSQSSTCAPKKTSGVTWEQTLRRMRPWLLRWISASAIVAGESLMMFLWIPHNKVILVAPRRMRARRMGFFSGAFQNEVRVWSGVTGADQTDGVRHALFELNMWLTS